LEPSLYEFALKNRPKPDSIDAIEGLLIDTYARSSKTFQGLTRLALVGYGEQAMMLARPQFEDMIVAHWIRRSPPAVERLEEFRLLTVERLRTKGHRYKLDDVPAQLPEPLPRERRHELTQKFSGGHHWTGLTLDDLVAAVDDEWPVQDGQRGLLWQIYEFDCFNANHLIHHGHAGLASGRVRQTEKDRAYNIGASPKYIREALRLGFFSYANTISLVVAPEVSADFSHVYSDLMLQSGFARTAV
jgi:hypothetical protein